MPASRGRSLEGGGCEYVCVCVCVLWCVCIGVCVLVATCTVGLLRGRVDVSGCGDVGEITGERMPCRSSKPCGWPGGYHLRKRVQLCVCVSEFIIDLSTCLDEGFISVGWA